MTLSQRVQSVKPSPTLAVSARAAKMRAAGKDIIGLGVGEPDFDTPDNIKQAGIEAINNGQTGYTAVDGTPELKDAIIRKFERDNGHIFKPEQILVSCGAKHSFYNLAQAILDPGDEVIIPAPYWVSYPDMAILAGGVPVFVRTDAEHAFKITPEQLKGAITKTTKLVIINSPSNPTGMAYTATELEELGQVLREHPNIIIVSDDIYEHIIWPGREFCNILMVCPDLYERTVVLNGVSKAYAMTGWRIGYAGGPDGIIKAMKKIQSQSTSNPTSIAQAAAIEALNGPQDAIGTMLTAFKKRHDYVVGRLNAMQGITCIETDGTFYVFPDMSGLIEKTPDVHNDLELGEYLIENAQLAMVPGTAFGLANFMRISIATSMEVLEKAMDRLEEQCL